MVAATAANDYAADALAHIQGMSASTRRYKTWFGAYNAANKAIVQSHFEKVSGDDISKYFYDCSCTSRDINAYVCTYTFRSRDCCSVADKPPDQIPVYTGSSTSADRSGKPAPLVKIPRPGFLSMRLPTSRSTAAPVISGLGSWLARNWPRGTQRVPS